MGFEYKGEVAQHTSQKGYRAVHLIFFNFFKLHFCSIKRCPSLDYSKGFGGKYGVEKEKVDKSALGYDYKGQTEKHQSQKGEGSLATVTFGGDRLMFTLRRRLRERVWWQIRGGKGEGGQGCSGIRLQRPDGEAPVPER